MTRSSADIALSCVSRPNRGRKRLARTATRRSELSDADRAVWLTQAEQAFDALASLGYRVALSEDAPGAQAEADRIAALAASAARKAESLLGLGEPLLAYNTIQKALVDEPGDLRLRQLRGLALARSGALQRANDALAALRTT